MPINRQRSLPSVDFTDPRIASLPPKVRLTAIGLRMYADDEGRGLVRLRLMLAELFEYDETMTEQILEEHLLLLDEAHWLRLYMEEGLSLFQIRVWPAVQHPEPSELPPPPGFMKPSREARETFAPSGSTSAALAGHVDEHLSPPGHVSAPVLHSAAQSLSQPAAPNSAATAGQDLEFERVKPSPFCTAHQPYGTEEACGPCRTTRYAFDVWQESARRVSLSAPRAPAEPPAEHAHPPVSASPRPRSATGPRFEPNPDQLDDAESSVWTETF